MEDQKFKVLENCNLKILIAEDSELSFVLTKTMIERLTGLEVDWAKNGSEAVEKVSQCGYDLVLMDHQMPLMSGIEATESIRNMVSLDRQPFICGLSGSTTPMDMMGYEKVGMNHFLAKPLRLSQLADLLEKVMLLSELAVEADLEEANESSPVAVLG